MERKTVSSSNIKSVGYEPATKTLEVEFTNGGVYQYCGVPQEKYNSLMQASSMGSYLASNIKNQYSCNKA